MSDAKTKKIVWNEKNKEKLKAQKKAWNIANPEKHKASKDKYRDNNKDRARVTAALWWAAHPEMRRIYNHNRRAKEKENGGKLTRDIAEKLFKLQRGKCPCCKLPLGEDYHLDHKMPVALGGANEDSNMQLLRAECNFKKNAKDPIIYMQSKGFLL